MPRANQISIDVALAKTLFSECWGLQLEKLLGDWRDLPAHPDCSLLSSAGSMLLTVPRFPSLLLTDFCVGFKTAYKAAVFNW